MTAAHHCPTFDAKKRPEQSKIRKGADPDTATHF